ncbi:MAG: recombinase RecA [Isosphaeraceae bacterium]|jgi:KaiC/GvpD/RAD55 family RecA-like ATPase|nr:MAG: recombinase RecA [Isosphaeraceae bacterium]
MSCPTGPDPAVLPRLRFGLGALDLHLGGGLLLGTLTVIAGTTGAGKTQLGVRWAAHGRAQEGRAGAIIDVTSRGDSQNHELYAQSQCDWSPDSHPPDRSLDADALWNLHEPLPPLYRPFAKSGRRPTRPDLDPDAWLSWQRDLARVLRQTAAFCYGHSVRGVRRFVIDGFEPTRNASESAQFDYFDYLYERVLRQDHDWAAREVFREAYRSQEPRVAAHPYDPRRIGALVLYTSPHAMLDDLLAAPLGGGDLLATANTVILMGRTRRDDGALGRALVVLKHRGSACSEEPLPYTLTHSGPVFHLRD